MINMLMVQGTTSDAGKSTLVAGICRMLKRRNIKVAPFKPQNMALNSAVTIDGGEIGRAQALQAQACGLEAHTDMNPVLLKPASDTGAQIIIQGRASHNMNAKSYHSFKPIAKKAVLESFSRMCEQYDVVVVEGAGSPAEINLREGDIANMGFAEEVDCPVILVADIDKGGVFAHLVGTLALLSESEQARVIGFVINKFRGDIALLEPGLTWLEERTGKPVLGVLPYLRDFYLDAEDAIDVRQPDIADDSLEDSADDTEAKLKVVVPVLPRISNHTDFDSLRLHPQVDLCFVSPQQTPPPCDLIILPGSKNVCHDIELLQSNGWQEHLNKHLRYGGKVMGICGGYQMLGSQINDPYGVEVEAGSSSAGFGFIKQQTNLHAEKTLLRIEATLSLVNSMGATKSAEVSAYEIHHGHSDYSYSKESGFSSPLSANGQKLDAYLSEDGQILGCYLHGIFDAPEACELLLDWAGLVEAKPVDLQAIREQEIERLADTAEKYLAVEKLNTLMGWE